MEQSHSDECCSGVASDVLACIRGLHTARRRARALERALEAERRTSRHVMRATDDVTLLVDGEGLILALNGQAAVAFGTTTTKAVGKPLWELLPQHLRERVAAAVQSAMKNGKPVTMLDQAFMPGTVHLRCDPVADSSGRIRRVVISAKDGSYAGSRQDSLQVAADHAKDGVVIVDRCGRVEYVNSAFEAITGWEAREVVGRGFRSIWSRREDRAVMRHAIRQLKEWDIYHEEAESIRRDGQPYRAAVTVCAVRRGTGELANVVGILHDITREASLSAHLRQAQKMEIMGRLAAGVVHDFRNQLIVIQGYYRLLLRGLAGDSPVRAYATEIGHAAENAGQLVQRLLRFCQGHAPRPQTVDLNQVLGDLVAPLLRLIDQRVRLWVTPSDKSCRVLADPTMLEQAIMNLVVNSCDAMPEGGILTIRSAVAGLPPDSPSAPPGVLLAIKDTGLGMDEATRRQALQAFFTTKPPGQGTGLGLPMVADFMKECGGRVEIDSRPGCGTEVRLWFPVPGEPACTEICGTGAT